MMETISVLLVFLVLLVFVLIFYIGMSQSTQQKRDDELSNLKAVEISQFASYMPELQCSSKNIIEENCFDKVKVEVFVDSTQHEIEGSIELNTTYYDVFRFSRIEVAQIYPSFENWTIYDRKPDKDNYNQIKAYIPINIYNPNTLQKAFGMLNVTVFS